MLRLAGELATFATSERRARDYPAYDHDDLENVFTPLIRDIQDFLSARLGRRAIRLEIIERAQNAFVSPIRDRSLFRNATLVLEVAAHRPLTEIQNDLPHLFKIGPNTKMNEIVHANLPGVPLVHLPTPHRIFAPSPITSISISTASRRCGPISAMPRRSGCISRATGRSSNCIYGRFWKTAMSDKDKPANPFGRVERTIIRPNPGRTAAASACVLRRRVDPQRAPLFATPRRYPRNSPLDRRRPALRPRPRALRRKTGFHAGDADAAAAGDAGGADAACRRTGGARTPIRSCARPARCCSCSGDCAWR